MFDAIRYWAKRVKQDSIMLWFAYRHPQTPWMVKSITAVALAYALSPIDLIPDFIPVLGYLDEALLLPAMVWLAVQCLPQTVKDECHRLAVSWLQIHDAKPVVIWGVVWVLSVWGIFCFLLWRWLS
ncbi:MAG: YkvA family protein [Limnohabitans sp.]